MQSYSTTTTALLANGSVCRWEDDERPFNPRMWANSVSTVSVGYNIQAALTHGSRVIVGTMLGHAVTDITEQVYERLGKDLVGPITEIHTYKEVLAVTSRDRVVIINMEHNDKGSWCTDSKLYVFPCGIDMIWFGEHHGFIRTNDNCLYLTEGDLAYNGLYTKTTCLKLEQIDFDAKSINNIICGPRYSVFIMDDTSIRTHGWASAGFSVNCHWAREDFIPLELKPKGHIIKVVSCKPYVFYISVEGLCYYKCSHIIEKTQESEEHSPFLLKSLAGLVVNNVFSIRGFFIIQHDGNRMCMLKAIYGRYTGVLVWVMDMDYVHGLKTPNPLLHFGDQHIVSVLQAHSLAYFITSEGHAYRGKTEMPSHTLTIERLEFFDRHPVAVESNRQRIASTRSCLDD